MEIEQIIKKLDWLDDERRKDKSVIAKLQERLTNLEANQPEILQQITDLSGEFTRLSVVSRFEKLESELGQSKVDLSRKVDALEKKLTKRGREAEKVRLGDLEMVNKTLGDLQKKQDDLKDIKKSINARVEEDFRLSRLIEELENNFEEYKRTDEDTKRLQKILEEGRRQDTKRLMDMQNEVIALRKRYDENRGKLDLITDDLHKTETRLKELLLTEQDRRQEQNEFIESQNLLQLERSREWKEMQVQFNEFSNRAAILDSQLQSLESINKAAKRAQEGFEDISSRLERRINEVTEMHRLMEERSRNDWEAFIADDQKRWANSSLVVEEKIRDISRRCEKLEERVVKLEDNTRVIQDVLAEFLAGTNREYNKILSLLKEWFDENEGLLGQIR